MPTASWNQLERAVEHLHAAAREALGVREYYCQFVAEVVAALDAAGAAVWRWTPDGRPEIICQSLPDDGVEADWSARVACVAKTPGGTAARFVDGPRDYEVLLCPVDQPVPASDCAAAPSAVIEVWMPHGASPPVRQAWLDFVTALADVAVEFHAREELRRLHGASALRGQAVEVIRRVSAGRSLAEAAFAVANEGRRILPCDRVTVLVRRGDRWRLSAVSAADAATRGSQFAECSERLAEELARWGEPMEYAAPTSDSESELPPRLAEVLESHIDHSHARALACVPLQFDADQDARTPRFNVVLLAERFAAGGPLREPLVELGELVAPALGRASQLERFPVNLALRWSERLSRLRQTGRMSKPLAMSLFAAGALAALMFVPARLTVEAPAHLAAAVEREIFATANGAVADVRVVHGQTVAAGNALIVLRDPELALKIQEVRGEAAAVRERLDALTVTRTDRTIREESGEDRLPLSAEQPQLEQRLASLERQRELLESQGDALTLRSPCAGQVLTRDVQTLLESRPVERGQALLTIADSTDGWELRAEVPQRSIGRVIDAQQNSKTPVTAEFRLAGDVDATYAGHVIEISAAAPLDADGLRDEPPPIEVRIAVDGAAPPAARPGMNATVRLDCGRRSLGYVWLHDAAATLYRWATF